MKKALAFILYIVMSFISPLWYKVRYLFLKPIYHRPMSLGVSDIHKELDALMKNFNYTYDNVKELGDAIVPPDYALHQLQHSQLYDDCDGFHAGVYQLLKGAGYKVSLVTSLNDNVMTNHVMVLFEHGSNLYLINYNKVINIFNGSITSISKKEFSETLTSLFTKECGSQSYYMFGLIFTRNRWFKRINLYDFFKL